MDAAVGLSDGPAGGANRVESIEVHTTDRWALRADLLEPPRAPLGVAVLAHALMARRSEFDRPAGAGLARFLVDQGWTALAFDFRGHGDSRPPASAEAAGCRYDDFVTIDLPAVCDFARWQVPDRPLVLVGHSLGGHVALAAVASGAVAVDAVIGLASAVWLPQLEPSLPRWLAKRAVLAAAAAVARRLGRLPARALRIGSDDETSACIEDLHRFATSGRWTSADGGVDYWASLDRVRVPVLQIVSDGDRFECPPVCGRRFIARCAGRRDVVEVATGDGGSPPPNHMGLVTGGRARQAWEQMSTWMSEVLHAGAPPGRVRPR